MNKENFLSRFNLDTLSKEITRINKEKDALEDRLSHVEEIKLLFGKLEKPNRREKDPGKYGVAVYFVESIEKDSKDIRFSYSPKMIHEGIPVIGTYHQTLDSPDADTWTARALVIKDDMTIIDLAEFSRSYRFLGEISD